MTQRYWLEPFVATGPSRTICIGCLDVTFREDECRVREHNAVQNWAVLRKMALNLLGQDTSKISLKAKRKKAAWNNDYMAQLLQINLMR